MFQAATFCSTLGPQRGGAALRSLMARCGGPVMIPRSWDITPATMQKNILLQLELGPKKK